LLYKSNFQREKIIFLMGQCPVEVGILGSISVYRGGEIKKKGI
jgi:hypothetical protein